MRSFGTAFLPRGEAGPSIPSAALSATHGCSRHPGHLRSFGKQRQMRGKLPETIGCARSADFMHHVRLGRPLVMRGCGNIQPARTRWTSDERIFDKAGNWNDTLPYDVGSHTTMFRDWLQGYRTRNASYVAWRMFDTRSPPFAPGLEEDVVVPESIVDALLHKKEFVELALMLWMNAGGRVSSAHFDSHDAILMQLFGTKRLQLIAPSESHKMYADFPLDTHGRTNFKMFGRSPIKVDAVDMCKYPQSHNLTVYTVTLQPGDAIYIPPVWWHVVRSFARRNVALTFQGEFAMDSAPRDLSAAMLAKKTSNTRMVGINPRKKGDAETSMLPLNHFRRKLR